jgi:hypothetical protein
VVATHEEGGVRHWEQEPDGTWALADRGSALFYVRSDNPKGWGTVTATSPTTDLEIRRGHNDVAGSLEESIEVVKALVEAYLTYVAAQRGS